MVIYAIICLLHLQNFRYDYIRIFFRKKTCQKIIGGAKPPPEPPHSLRHWCGVSINDPVELVVELRVVAWLMVAAGEVCDLGITLGADDPLVTVKLVRELLCRFATSGGDWGGERRALEVGGIMLLVVGRFQIVSVKNDNCLK